MPAYFAKKPKAAAPVKRKYSSIPEKTFEEKKLAANKLRSQSGKPPRKNIKRQERLAVIRRQKHSAYRRSECYKAVELRSGGRCERKISGVLMGGYSYPSVGFATRCPNKRSDGLRMTHNHKTYARYGGKELPEDMELLCPTCNSAYESAKRGNRSWKSRKVGGGRLPE